MHVERRQGAAAKGLIWTIVHVRMKQTGFELTLSRGDRDPCLAVVADSESSTERRRPPPVTAGPLSLTDWIYTVSPATLPVYAQNHVTQF